MHVFQRSNFFPPSRWDFSRRLLKKFSLPLLVSTILTWCCAHTAVFYLAAVATWGVVEAKQIINLFVGQVSELQKPLGSWFNRLRYFKRDGRRRLVLNARKDPYDLNGNYKVSLQTHCTKSWRKWWNCDLYPCVCSGLTAPLHFSVSEIFLWFSYNGMYQNYLCALLLSNIDKNAKRSLIIKKKVYDIL